MSFAPDPAAIRAFEERAFRAWPAFETRDFAGWRQRFADGYTKRSNSINALSASAEVSAGAIAALEAPYRAAGRMPAWRLSPLAPPAMAEELRRLGYREIEESEVQLAQLDGSATLDPEAHIEEAPGAGWITAQQRHNNVAPAQRPAMERLVRAVPAPAAFLSIGPAHDPLGCALGVLDGDHVGLCDVIIAPAARRQGLARRLTESVYAWGFAHGARFAWLQVVATNTPAKALYAAQGFRPVYRYRYLVP
ncbi:MAG: GNAT family N-acetyltransferase [Alphaproteobacteria bacterium]|nr:GNAT family N-acetyltransferase [Alphaproteobacteria bacterium]